MKAKKGFNLRKVCGENIIVAVGKENIDFSNIICMNETSAFLWRKVQEMESFNETDLAQFLTEEYQVTMEVALNDAATLIEQWLEAGIINE